MGFWVFFSDDRVEYYDSDACTLYLSPNHPVEIVNNSKTILDFLIENRNVAIYRDHIIAKIDGIEESQSYSNKKADRDPVDQAIAVLRKKLDKYRSCISTVRGVGYKYVGPPKVDKQFPTSQPNTLSPLSSEIEEDVDKDKNMRSKDASAKCQNSQSIDSTRDANETSVSISIQAAIKMAGIKISAYEIRHGRPPTGNMIEPFLEQIIVGFLDNVYSDILGISARAWEEYAVGQKAQAILLAYVYELNSVNDLTPDDSNSRS